MTRLRYGPWSGPECPWCDGDMTHVGVIEEPDDDYDIFQCRRLHTLRVPQNRDDQL